MKDRLFELLRQRGFLKRHTVDSRRIGHTEIREILDVAQASTEATVKKSIEREDSIFVHFATSSLGGGRASCSTQQCRLERAYELAQFAALYSDRVYISNFFADYKHFDATYPPDRLRYEFDTDIKVLALLEPLIKEGKIIPFTTPDFCPGCFVKESYGADALRRMEKEYGRLLRSYLENIKCEARLIEKTYKIKIDGPEKLIEHGCIFYNTYKLSPPLKPSSMRRLDNGECVKITRAEINKLKLHEGLVGRIQQDIKFELFASQIFHAAFLTERDLHIDILNAISENSALRKRNVLVEKYLTALVPFLNDIKITELIELRRREQDSFVLFRQSLNRAIDEYKKSGEQFTAATAKEIFSDIISPQMARLDQKIGAAKRDLVKSTRRKALGWAGALSFGIYSGFIPAELAAAATALGLSKVVADILEMAMTKSDKQETIKNEEMYFLWRVRQLSRK